MRSSATKRAPSCSNASRCPKPGRSRRPTSLSRNISGAMSDRPSSARSSSSSDASSTRSPTGRASRSKLASDAALSAFSDDLKYLLVHQQAAFNSPVWFNCGFERRRSARRASSIPSTTRWNRFSPSPRPRACCSSSVRAPAATVGDPSSKELLAGGGTASGPVSFMKGFDAFAGVIKSGGKTRRAAKMVILNAEHPDILEFINCKVEEEEGVGADRRRLRRLVHRHRLRLGVLPELEQLRSRHRRIHARGAGRRPVADQGGDQQ